MDKALFRAYVKELVKEQIGESVEKAVRKILPEILSEAVSEIKNINESATTKPAAKKLSREQLASMMGLTRDGDTFTASTSTMPVELPPNADPNSPAVKGAVDAITKDYSSLMKAMKIT